MNVFLLFLAVLSSIHAYSYGIWLRENQQFSAFVALALCAIINLVLPLYRLYSQA